MNYFRWSHQLVKKIRKVCEYFVVPGVVYCLVVPTVVHAQRYTPPGLCAITSNSDYESLTLPIAIGGEYPSGSTQTITIAAGDTEQPGGNQAFTGDTENVVIFIDSNGDGTPEVFGAGSCIYDQGAAPPGCSVTQNITLPAVTEDTTFRGRVMLSFGDTTPTNSCGNNGFGDSEDFLIVANVEETITIADVSAPEDGGPISVTAVLSHDVVDAAGFVPFTVEFVLADGTATQADSDYTAATGTLFFNGQAGNTATITVNPVSDIIPEPDETLIVSLQNLSNSTHGIDISDTATVTLLDDDEAIDLVLSKSVTDDRPNVGDTIVFTLQVDNLGPDDANDVSVQDLVPAGLGSVAPVSVPPGTSFNVSGNTVDWSGLNVTVGSPVSAQYSAIVLPP